ncbi:MAG: hypothetical protein AB7O43_13820 [Hyphomicrobiaceae bacterium]
MKKLAMLLLAAMFGTATVALPLVSSTPVEAATKKAKSKSKTAKAKKKAPKKKSAKRSGKKKKVAKTCGTYKYMKGGKCMDARGKKG